MTKNELMNDMEFRSKCLAYGLDWSNFYLYGNVIFLNTPKRYVYVLLDENYNTIGIHKVGIDNVNLTQEVLADKYLYLYTSVGEREFALPYPFQNFSLKQLVELSDRIFIHETNHGHSYDMIVNGELVNDNEDSKYVSLLSYIKFLGGQIKQYFLNAYQMKMLGFEYPSVYSYMQRIVADINEYINVNAEKGNRILPRDIIEYLGQDRKNVEEYNHELYNIIDLLVHEKELKVECGFENEVVEKDETDLSCLAMDLLKILEIPKDEVEARIEESNKIFKMNEINLQSWLVENLGKDKMQSLIRAKGN